MENEGRATVGGEQVGEGDWVGGGRLWGGESSS